jgi:tetraacyldisaccharide 4'-kinase
MRAPEFWWEPGRGVIVAPLGFIYGAVAAQRMKRPGASAGVPVICLGNLTVGGAGKTPAALAVVRILLAAHLRPFFLSRGYGGTTIGPQRVDVNVDTAAAVGDEPLLLARLAPTIVAHDRVAGARMARRGGASVIVMDDGFQNPSLAKDLSILVIDGKRGIGNGRIFPAGPLRAPLETQIARAHALLVVGDPTGAAAVISMARGYGLAIYYARIEPDPQTLAALRGRRVLAFAGIGDPQKFFTTLREAGLTVAAGVGFPDHHAFTQADARALLAQADAGNLLLLTTEKDQVRLTRGGELTALAQRASALPVRLVIDNDEDFKSFILATARRTEATPRHQP